MRDAGYPGREFPVFSVSSLLDCQDSLDKSFLKNIIGQILVFDYAEDIVENSVLLPFEGQVEWLSVIIMVWFDFGSISYHKINAKINPKQIIGIFE